MYWFECQKDEPYLKMVIGGCMTHDHTKRLKIGESYVDGDYVSVCSFIIQTEMLMIYML